MSETIVDIVTQEWIEVYENPENRKGFTWRMALSGNFPEGVDTHNPKVVEILNGGEDANQKRFG